MEEHQKELTREKELFIPKLREIHIESPMTFFVIAKELAFNSILINPVPYIKRHIHMALLKKDVRAIALKKQKFMCPSCNKPIFDWDSLIG